MAKVLVDTSFLIHLAEKPVGGLSLIEEKMGPIEFVVLKQVLDELGRMIKGRSVKKVRKAKAALRIVSALKLVPQSEKGDVDSSIVRYGERNRVIVATLDSELRARLRRRKITVISVRNDRVFLDGAI